MSEFALYREPTVLDSVKHRGLKLTDTSDYAVAAGMRASFLAAAEFAHAAHDYVIVFVRAELDGPLQMQPIAVLGMALGENLFVEDGGARWDARYVPAYIRRYPFWTANFEGQGGLTLLFDAAWRGFSSTEGAALYDDQGGPAPRLTEVIDFVRTFEEESTRTLAVCARLEALGLLREMNASVAMSDGRALGFDGFFTVDEAKLKALPEDTVVELHRSGMLGAIHAHLISLNNLEALAMRKTRRDAARAAG